MPDKTTKDERLSNLDQLALLVENRSLIDYDFKRATGLLAQDLKFISDALCRDVDVWRMNRPRAAVHHRLPMLQRSPAEPPFICPSSNAFDVHVK